jgi:hypothetical protein
LPSSINLQLFVYLDSQLGVSKEYLQTAGLNFENDEEGSKTLTEIQKYAADEKRK